MFYSKNAPSNPGGGTRTPACLTVAGIVLATALATSAAPVSAADLDVNASLKNYINTVVAARYHTFLQDGLDLRHWEVKNISVKRLRAPPVFVKGPKTPYTILAVKGVAKCPDPVFGNPAGSVMTQVEFIKTVSNETSVTKTSGTKTGVTASVQVMVKFPRGEATAAVAVNHEKSKSESNRVTHRVSETIRERLAVTLNGPGGKWGVLWARQHKAKDIPYTAVFEPLDDDIVSITARNWGTLCIREHSGFSGAELCFGAEKHIPNMKAVGFNDAISSIADVKNKRLDATYYEHSNYRGKSFHHVGGYTSLKGWKNDSISSIKFHGIRELKVPYKRIKAGLPPAQRQFKVTGKISVNMIQATQTRLVEVPMTKAEYNEYCAFSGGAVSSGIVSKKILGGKKTKGKRAAIVRDVPAAKVANMKFKAPK